MLTLTVTPHGSVAALLADATEAAIDALLDWAGGPAYTADGYSALVKKLTPQLNRAVLDIVVAAESVLKEAHEAELAIDAVNGAALATQVADMRAELRSAGAPRISDLDHGGPPAGPGPLSAGADGPGSSGCARIRTVIGSGWPRSTTSPRRSMRRSRRLRPERAADPDVTAVRRLLAEYRVASFAQPMRTTVPVSEKRLLTAIAALSP